MFFAGFDLLFSILFPILFLVVLGMILYAIIGNIRTWNKNNHSPRLTVPATVVAKRTEVSHHHTDNTMMHTFTTYYVTFQVESGDRMELTVRRLRVWDAGRERHWKAEFSRHPLSWVPAELSVSALLPNWMNRKLNKAGLHTKKHLLPLCRT